MVLDGRGPIIAMPPPTVPAILIIDDEQEGVGCVLPMPWRRELSVDCFHSGAEGSSSLAGKNLTLILLDLGDCQTSLALRF